MDIRYQILADGGVWDLQTRTRILPNRSDPAWQAYQRWLTEGGTPLPAEVDPAPREQVEARQWSWIKQRRERAKRGGVFVEGKWFHSDDASRLQQLGLKGMGADVPPVPWKTMDGTFVPMSQALAAAIFQAVVDLDIAAFAVAEAHKAAMLASPDPAAYDYSGGWPPSFGD